MLLRGVASGALVSLSFFACSAGPSASTQGSAAAPSNSGSCGQVGAAIARAGVRRDQGQLERALRELGGAPASCPARAAEAEGVRHSLLAALGRCAELPKAAPDEQAALCAARARESSDTLLARARAAPPGSATRAESFDRALHALEREGRVTAELLDLPVPELELSLSSDGKLAFGASAEHEVVAHSGAPDRWTVRKVSFEELLAVSPKGDRALVRRNGAALVLRLPNMEKIATIALDLRGGLGSDIEISPDGRRAVAVQGLKVHLLDLDSGKLVTSVEEQFESSGSGVRSVSFEGQGRFVLVDMLNEGTVVLAAESGTRVASLRERSPMPLVITDDQRHLIHCTSGDDGSFYSVLDLEAGGKVVKPHGVRCDAPADPRGLLVSIEQGEEVFTDVRSGKRVSAPSPPSEPVRPASPLALVPAFEALAKSGPNSVAISLDGRLAEIDGSGAIELASGKLDRGPLPKGECDVRFGPCRRLVQVPGGANVCPTTSDECQLLSLPHPPSEWLLSRDGAVALVWSGKSFSIADLAARRVIVTRTFPSKVVDADFVGVGAVESQVEVLAGGTIERLELPSGKLLNARLLPRSYESGAILRGGMGALLSSRGHQRLELVGAQLETRWLFEDAASKGWSYWPEGQVLMIKQDQRARFFELPAGRMAADLPYSTEHKLVAGWLRVARRHAGAELTHVREPAQRVLVRRFGPGDHYVLRQGGDFTQVGKGVDASVVVRGDRATRALSCRLGEWMFPFELCAGRFQVDAFAVSEAAAQAQP